MTRSSSSVLCCVLCWLALAACSVSKDPASASDVVANPVKASKVEARPNAIRKPSQPARQPANPSPIASQNAPQIETGNADASQRAFAKAFKLHTANCQAKDFVACNDVGIDYELGRGVAKDLPKALSYY